MPSIRELGRVDHWWYSKVAPALAVAYSASLLYRLGPLATARSILLIAFVGLCAGSYGHVINDVFDIEVDRLAGKRNHMANFRPWQRFLICGLLIGAGFGPSILISHSSTTLVLLGLEYLLPTIYSVPPLRLKEFGALGVLCDSLGAHLVPCLYVLSVVTHEAGDPALTHSRSAVAFVWLVAAWALCLGLIAIVIHEFEDRENDLRSGIRTFATGLSFAQVRWPVTVLYAAELCAFAGIAILLIRPAPLVAVFAVVYALTLAIKVVRHWNYFRRYEEDRRTIQWWQFSHPFYEFYFPLAAALQCAWRHPALTPFPVLQLTFFAHTFREQLPDLRALPVIATELLWRGRLDLDHGARARIRPAFFPMLGARVEIEESGTEPRSVRLVRPRLRLRAGQGYRVSVTVRADCARRILVGVWQDHAPGDGLGFCEECQVSPQWLHLSKGFTAPVDERHAYVGFWIGREAGVVEVRHCSIQAVGPKIK